MFLFRKLIWTNLKKLFFLTVLLQTQLPDDFTINNHQHNYVHKKNNQTPFQTVALFYPERFVPGKFVAKQFLILRLFIPARKIHSVKGERAKYLQGTDEFFYLLSFCLCA